MFCKAWCFPCYFPSKSSLACNLKRKRVSRSRESCSRFKRKQQQIRPPIVSFAKARGRVFSMHQRFAVARCTTLPLTTSVKQMACRMFNTRTHSLVRGSVFFFHPSPSYIQYSQGSLDTRRGGRYSILFPVYLRCETFGLGPTGTKRIMFFKSRAFSGISHFPFHFVFPIPFCIGYRSQN